MSEDREFWRAVMAFSVHDALEFGRSAETYIPNGRKEKLNADMVDAACDAVESIKGMSEDTAEIIYAWGGLIAELSANLLAFLELCSLSADIEEYERGMA